MNDLKDHLLDNRIFILLYVDDLQIYVQIPSSEISNGISYVSQSAKIVAKWAETNCLSLNTKKTQAIVFGSSYTIKQFKNLNIPSIEASSCGDNVPFVDEVTSLSTADFRGNPVFSK